MAVAKSYASCEILCEPFVDKGKKYVNIKTKTGTEKRVRWYTDAEYQKMYGTEADTENFGNPEVKKFQNYKTTLGFSEGYITIFKGDTYSALDWFKATPQCRYSNLWGWYVVSTETVPADLPEGIEAIKLLSEKIFVNDNQIKSETEIKAAVADILYAEKIGEFVGEVGDKVEAYLTVEAITPLEGYFGPSNMYRMFDDIGNLYIWTTAAKQLEVGQTYNIKGTIKELKTYKNLNENILTRCRVS